MILDTVWMVVNTKYHRPPSVIYRVGTSAAAVWQQIEETEWMGTGVTAEMLRKQGYRARRVQIVRVEK